MIQYGNNVIPTEDEPLFEQTLANMLGNSPEMVGQVRHCSVPGLMDYYMFAKEQEKGFIQDDVCQHAHVPNINKLDKNVSKLGMTG